MNRSEVWMSISEKSVKLAVAGFKSHLTRNLKKARTERQKNEVKTYWESRIQNYIDSVRSHNESVKRHNAALKAHSTRKAAKATKTRNVACKRTVRAVSR